MYGLTISASTIFQLTTSRRGRPYFILSPGCSRSFNSRPHAEVDSTARDGVYPLCALSTHDLTQRSTSFQVCWIPAIHLSTHDLTQRSTAILTTSCRRNALSTHDLTQRSTRLFHVQYSHSPPFNSRPHAEVDQTRIRLFSYHVVFQLTTSRKGRRFCVSFESFPSIFQLTTSRRGRPVRWCSGQSFIFFQLTTSRRGRPE